MQILSVICGPCNTAVQTVKGDRSIDRGHRLSPGSGWLPALQEKRRLPLLVPARDEPTSIVVGAISVTAAVNQWALSVLHLASLLLALHGNAKGTNLLPEITRIYRHRDI